VDAKAQQNPAAIDYYNLSSDCGLEGLSERLVIRSAPDYITGAKLYKWMAPKPNPTCGRGV
jgi:hypothetical protein